MTTCCFTIQNEICKIINSQNNITQRSRLFLCSAPSTTYNRLSTEDDDAPVEYRKVSKSSHKNATTDSITLINISTQPATRFREFSHIAKIYERDNRNREQIFIDRQALSRHMCELLGTNCKHKSDTVP